MTANVGPLAAPRGYSRHAALTFRPSVATSPAIVGPPAVAPIPRENPPGPSAPVVRTRSATSDAVPRTRSGMTSWMASQGPTTTCLRMACPWTCQALKEKRRVASATRLLHCDETVFRAVRLRGTRTVRYSSNCIGVALMRADCGALSETPSPANVSTGT